MRATEEQVEALEGLQKADMAISRLTREIEALPQRAEIAEVRRRRAALQDRRRTLVGMRKDAEADIDDLKDQDAVHAARQVEAQEAINDAAGNYHEISTRTRALENHTAKRAALAAKIDELETRVLEASELEEAVDGSLAALDTRERALASAFRDSASGLASQLEALKERRARLVAAAGDDIVAEYGRIAAHKGGVAVGRLEEGKCTACRAPIEPERILALRAEAPLGACPRCGRMMVVPKR